MTVEDFSADWTEVDPSSRITMTSTAVSGQVNNAEDMYVYRDMGVDHFDGDFLFVMETELANDEGAWNRPATLFGLANVLDDFSANYPSLWSRWYNFQGAARLYIFASSSAGSHSGSFVDLAKETRYYLEFERDEAVGTFGTLYIRIYSDAARTTLVDTLVQSIPEHNDFRYAFAIASFDGTGNTSPTVTLENLDFQEAGGGGGSILSQMTRYDQFSGGTMHG